MRVGTIGAAALLCGLALLLGGCRYWYKPGSGADDLARDEQACREQAGDDPASAAFYRCMETLGWSAGGSSTTETAPVRTPAAAAPAAEPGAVPRRAAETGVVPAAAPALDAQPEAGSAGDPQPPSGAPVVGAPVPPGAEPLSDPVRKDAAPVHSWWKRGGRPDELQATRRQCAEATALPPQQAGEAGWEAHGGFVRCMEERGWRGLR